MKHQNAFTMIELIFVIIILGILAAVAIPKLAAMRYAIELQQLITEYKKQNPYRAVIIESLLETGMITASVVTLPETGIPKLLLHLNKNAAQKIATAVPYMEGSKKVHVSITKAAYEQYLLHSGTPVPFMNKKIIKRNIFKQTPENIDLMKSGNAPIGIDGKPVQLHHMGQQNNGTLVEVLAQDEHQAYTQYLHSNSSASQIDRQAFNSFRSQYWKMRANEY